MNRELAILLTMLLLTGFGTAWIVFNHNDSRDPDPLYRVQTEVCGKLRRQAVQAFRRHDHFEAERYLRRLLKINPDDREMQLLFGRVLLETRREFEAEKLFRKIAADNLLDSGARNNIGVVLLLRGRYEDALMEFSAASRLDSGKDYALPNLEIAKKCIELHNLNHPFAVIININKIYVRCPGALSAGVIFEQNSSGEKKI